MDPLSLDPDVRVTPSHNDVIDALNGAFLSDIPDLSTIAVTEIGVIPPPPMFSSPSPPPPPLPPTTMANNSHQVLIIDMYSQFLRCCTARRSSTGYSQFSPSKFEACKSYLFTESFIVLKIKPTWLICFVLYVRCVLA